MDPNVLNLPFIREAQGSLAWVITVISIVLMLWDRVGKILAGRQAQKDGDQKGKVDRFEAISEAEARLREVYEQRDKAMNAEVAEVKATNKTLTAELQTANEEIGKLQRSLRGAEDRIASLERQLKGA